MIAPRLASAPRRCVAVAVTQRRDVVDLRGMKRAIHRTDRLHQQEGLHQQERQLMRWAPSEQQLAFSANPSASSRPPLTLRLTHCWLGLGSVLPHSDSHQYQHLDCIGTRSMQGHVQRMQRRTFFSFFRTSRRVEEGTDEDEGGKVLDPETLQRKAEMAKQKLEASREFERLPFPQRLFKFLNLTDSKFTAADCKMAFDQFDSNGDGYLQADEVRSALFRLYDSKFPKETIEHFARSVMERLDLDHDGEISRAEFDRAVLEMAEKLDPRVWPVAACMFLCGSGVGVIIPSLPILAQTLGITTAGYGLVVAALGASKLLCNIPAAVLCDRYGRRPFMTSGMLLMGMSMAAVALSQSLEHLVISRFISGVGIAGFTGAATLYLTDISNALNRARTLAPTMVTFAAGATLGPAIGGALTHAIGVGPTFYVVGGIFTSLAGYCHVAMQETLTAKREAAPTVAATVRDTFSQWQELYRIPELRQLYMLNVLYWISLGGSQMTLLPLMLVDDKFGFGPSGVGLAFGAMSLVSVLFAQPSAYLADRLGKTAVIIPACLFIGAAQGLFPETQTTLHLASVLFMWSLGSAMVTSAPTAYITELTKPKTRSQAMALMRTMGDVGLLVGASLTGTLAFHTSMEATMQFNSFCLFGATALFAASTLSPAVRALAGSKKPGASLSLEQQQQEQQQGGQQPVQQQQQQQQ